MFIIRWLQVSTNHRRICSPPWHTTSKRLQIITCVYKFSQLDTAKFEQRTAFPPRTFYSHILRYNEPPICSHKLGMLLERLTFCDWRASAALCNGTQSSCSTLLNEPVHKWRPTLYYTCTGMRVPQTKFKIEVCFDNSGAISRPLALEGWSFKYAVSHIGLCTQSLSDRPGSSSSQKQWCRTQTWSGMRGRNRWRPHTSMTERLQRLC